MLIPVAVQDELARFHSVVPPFLEVRSAADQARVASLLAELDRGEAEAIVLAAECQADFLLIDERRGRKMASLHGVPSIGLLGVLLLAKQGCLISSIEDCIADLRDKAGFYMAQPLIERILEAAREH